MSSEPNGEWPLLAKYLVDEASQEERFVVEALLKENEDLRRDFQKLMAAYFLDGKQEEVNPSSFFKKLDSRIKNTDQ